MERIGGSAGAGAIYFRISAGDDAIFRWRGDVKIRGEPVHGIAAERKPTRGVQKITVIGMEAGELDSVDRRLFITSELAIVGERDFAGLAFLKSSGEGDAY